MILIPSKRLWTTVTTLLLAVFCGAGIGFLLGRANTRRLTEDRLLQEAHQGGEPFITLMEESDGLLSVLNASKFPFCSDAEIAFFRQQVFHSENLRDAGRMRNGKMECSALFGREKLLEKSFQPTLTRLDGLKIYHNLPPYLPDKHIVFLFQKGDSYVVEDPRLRDHFVHITTHYESTLVDRSTHQRIRPSGGTQKYPGAIVDRDARGRVGDILFVTECTPRDYICTTAYESFSTVLWQDRGQIAMDSSAGGLLGAFLALLYSLIYQRSRNMSQQLRRAIRHDKLQMVYQPIVALGSGKIVEAEALARWTDEDGFAVSPEIFVAIAEEHGFVGELTEMVMRHVMRDFAGVLRSRPNFMLNINVAAADLADPKFLPMLEHYLAEAGVSAHSLAIEVTETSTANKQPARDTIHELRRLGHSVQIDDFGTGCSSLAYLKDLAIDTIKIDKAFTLAIGTEAVTVGILPPILAMADALNLTVIAEGIETIEQACYFAAAKNAVLGQGWFFGHPVAAADFCRILAENQELEDDFADAVCKDIRTGP